MVIQFQNIFVVGQLCPVPPRPCPSGQSAVFLPRSCDQKCVPDVVTKDILDDPNQLLAPDEPCPRPIEPDADK